ncbi:hypothetical protein RHGRI_024502 [Rhododendron griersonianum]|uniref:Uncharacterized protein n=1 Tax=Rhododendron griersonianum TaxID=479676 RepID=A0AAV6J7C8_9ERIC|nr:hypothetical protein RHGRI_024502 [Rhododendron griersonianum]
MLLTGVRIALNNANCKGSTSVENFMCKMQIPSRSRRIRTTNLLIQTLMRNPNSISQLLCQLCTLKMGRQPPEFA